MQKWDLLAAQAVMQLSHDHPYKLAYESASETKPRIAEAVYFLQCKVAGPRMKGPTAEVAARLILGETPAEIFPELTTKEANAFCAQETFVEPNAWLWDELAKDYDEIANIEAAPPKLAIVKWLQGQLCREHKREALSRVRIHVAEGREVEGSILERLDELEPEDLSDSISDTLNAAFARNLRERWSGPEDLIPRPEWANNLPKGVRLLTTAMELLLEGSQMRHCVMDYCRRVHEKKCLIWSIQINGDRATVQTDLNGRVTQIAGFANKPSPKTCRDMANDLHRYVR